MTAPARGELKAAHTALAAAGRELETARAATNKARALHEGTVRQTFEHEAGERRASVSLKDRIKAAIKGGADPAFDQDIENDAAARTALDARRRAAEQAVADLGEEEREAEKALERAKSAVDLGVIAVMRTTAEELVRQWTDAEAEARAARRKRTRDDVCSDGYTKASIN